MKLRIGLMSDTHGFVDDAIFQYFDQCDEVWHAGDFGPVEVLDSLKLFKPICGVWGNVDGAEVRAELPRELEWECAGVKVFMVHIGGYPGNYDRRIKAHLNRMRPGLFICGHSHILKIMRDPAIGLIHMNPGASGHHGWHTMRTLLRFSVEDGRIHEVEAIELGPRGKKLSATNDPKNQK